MVLVILFSYILLLNCVNHLTERKIKELFETHYFRGYIRAVYKIFGLKVAIITKVIVILNCRTGYKFEYYQKRTNTRF